MKRCQLCGKSENNDLYCARCDKIAADVMADLQAELKV